MGLKIKMVDDVVVVSGLPRSGTSMLMKMLDAGGIKPLTDEIREADVDNPRGYYEFERVKKLPQESDWVPRARGKAVKVLAELIKHLPQGYNYKVVFMQRRIPEIIASQKKMLVRRGEDPNKVSDEEMEELLRNYLMLMKSYINDREDMMVCYVSYNDLLEHPRREVKALNRFLGGVLDEEEMVSVIEPNLYRNRG
ncbi:MAG: sulfotransferase family protein [Candidatus Altiarchaeales archaeon ex4484_96]|nr:MAG: sulfotransferase family protein [Candidatus Altiarchaeales archaeon ex4484_96]